MGFRDAKHGLIAALQAVQRGEISLLHEPREDPEKNHLKRGTVTVAEVLALASKASAGPPQRPNYRSSQHHLKPDLVVHELWRIRWQHRDWYLKWYFESPDLCFISVHPSDPSTTTDPPTGGTQ